MAEMTPAPGCNGTTMRTITPGSGKEITKGSTATVHATGVVKESGQKFWSTKDPGQEPFTYQAGVISAIVTCGAGASVVLALRGRVCTPSTRPQLSRWCGG